MQTRTDAELLREYAANNSEAAFGEIVRRYADFVYSAALRQVGEAEPARDVAQMVFVDLARKAGSLRANTVLIGWLCQGARLAALEQRRKDQRRQHRERQAMESFDPAPETPDDWNGVRPVLDEAIASLDHADRDALLLRYFKNESLSVVGTALGVSEGAAQKRVSRALDKLRDILAGRGIKTTASALSLVLAVNAVQAAPAGFAGSLAAAALVHTAVAESSTIPFLKLLSLNMKTAIVILVLGGGLAVMTALQVNTRSQLHQAQAQSRLLADDLAELRAANDQLAAQNGELDQLRAEIRDLPRLRGEVARLRGQATVADAAPVLPAAVTEDASSHTNVPGPTLLIQAKFVSLPRDALKSLNAAGLPYLADGGTALLTESQTKIINDALKNADDVSVIGRPQVITRGGTAATVSVTQAMPMGGTNAQVGISLEVAPKVLGSVFDLDLVARLNQIVDDSPQGDGSQRRLDRSEAKSRAQLVEGQTLVLVKDVANPAWLGDAPPDHAASGPLALLVFITPTVLKENVWRGDGQLTQLPLTSRVRQGDTNTFVGGDPLKAQAP